MHIKTFFFQVCANIYCIYCLCIYTVENDVHISKQNWSKTNTKPTETCRKTEAYYTHFETIGCDAFYHDKINFMTVQLFKQQAAVGVAE